ncbi:MAG: DNA alkylation repair protein [Planctomycetota bacterium]
MAKRPSEVPSAVVRGLNAGTRESANLAEGLAVDFRSLMGTAFPEVDRVQHARVAPEIAFTKRMADAAEVLIESLGPGEAFARCRAHGSDTVRGWAAYVLGRTPRLSLKTRLTRVRPLADDHHFGVREWAWLGIRAHIVADPIGAIDLLEPWVTHRSSSVRRFAIEATRPRGVWSAHIEALKEDPSVAIALLEPCRADAARYVQDSVANWLNDASKSQPDWVREVCARWSRESNSECTDRICRRALRSVR